MPYNHFLTHFNTYYDIVQFKLFIEFTVPRSEILKVLSGWFDNLTVVSLLQFSWSSVRVRSTNLLV